MGMKRIVLAILFLLFIGFGVFTWYVSRNVGDLGPALLPSSEQVEEIFSRRDTGQAQGEPVNFPLRLPEPLQIGLFSTGLGAPRDLALSTGGTLLVSVPQSGEVVALPDKDNNGRADEKKVVLSGLRKPHGLAFYEGKLFVAEETRLVRYTWSEENLSAQEEKELFALPAGGRHTSRSLAFDLEGNLYVSLGSRCDTCFESEPWIGTVVRTNSEGDSSEVYSTGLRNAVFLTQRPNTNQIWTTEMGRDLLGDDLPPDEINLLQEGGNFGWPVCYGDRVYDSRFGQRTPEHCQSTISPKFALPAHVAPLGLRFIDSPQFPSDWRGDILVALHGSWNSTKPVGYKVVRLEVNGDEVLGMQDFLTGFLDGREALGRPVDLEFDNNGTLYISDDKAGVIYRVTRVSEAE
jgi:glucose/arabinose dehydrogenase